MKKTELFRIILQLEARVASLEDSRADYHIHVDKRVASLEFELSRAIQRIASLELRPSVFPAPPAPMTFPTIFQPGQIIAQAGVDAVQGACDQFGYLAAGPGILQNAGDAVHYEQANVGNLTATAVVQPGASKMVPLHEFTDVAAKNIEAYRPRQPDGWKGGR